MDIAGLERCSTVDYPGKLCAVLFAAGCNFDCFYCHNRQLIKKPCPLLSSKEVWPFLEDRRGLLSAVVISGGEPTLYDDLPGIAERLRGMGYLVKLDTNGSCPGMLKLLLANGLLDYISIDNKAPWDKYRSVCRTDTGPETVRMSMEIAAVSGIPWELRTTLIPGLTYDDCLRLVFQTPQPVRYTFNRYRRPEVFSRGDEILLEHEVLQQDMLEDIVRRMGERMPGTKIII